MSLALMMLIAALFVGLVLVAIPNAVWLLWWLVSAIAHCPKPAYAPFGYTALGLAVAAWLVLGYGFLTGRFRYEVKPLEYSHPDIPEAFDGYRIVQISDLHLSTYRDRPAALQRIVAVINAQHPDLICFTGDLVTIGIAEAQPFVSILQQLRASDGIVSVLGNHDMMIYTPLTEAERTRETELLARLEQDTLGWQLLRNRHITISRNGQTLTVAGVDNCSCGNEGFRSVCCGDLEQALAQSSGFCILLSHDPTHWRAEVLPATDVPLTLSGHTHAGQVRLFGKTLADRTFRESAGWYCEDGQSLYVNTGIGCTLPVRLNCPSEITVITLKRGAKRRIVHQESHLRLCLQDSQDLSVSH